MPDRRQVSNYASKVWKKFYERKYDIKKEKLNNNLTTHNLDYLNYCYYKDNHHGYDFLVANNVVKFKDYSEDDYEDYDYDGWDD